MLDVFKVLETDANTDQIWSDSTLDLFLVGQLLVSRDPWVDDERFGIADVSQVTAQFQIIDNCADFVNRSSLWKRLVRIFVPVPRGRMIKKEECSKLTTPKVRTPPPPFGMTF